jgi:hypothetical protein
LVFFVVYSDCSAGGVLPGVFWGVWLHLRPNIPKNTW